MPTLERALTKDVPIAPFLAGNTRRITDDRPFNEYYILRRTWNRLTGQHKIARTQLPLSD